MPTPVYAQHLIELLKACGLDQNTIASRLGTNKTSVSWWATGQRPIAHRHVKALLRLVAETIKFAPESQRSELTALVRAWAQELDVRMEHCQQAIQHYFSILQSPYAQRKPLSIDPRERQRLANAALALAHELTRIDHIDSMPDSSFIPNSWHIDVTEPSVEPDPLAEFARVAATYHINPEEKEDARAALRR